MKIFIIKVPAKLQPHHQNFVYPAHNKDYGVEQDFLIWLQKNPQLLTSDSEKANWHYLPVYWTRWHINHNFAAESEGITELQSEVDRVMINPDKTFTVTQFDGGTLLDLGNIIEFTAARTTNKGIDIPILCSPHKRSPFPVRKKYLASFNGSADTHPIRKAIMNSLSNRSDVLIEGGVPTRFYKRWILGKQFNLNTQASYIALCPRGTSTNSFRFFEAMQLGVAPCLIGDMDVRPFRKFIDWNAMSYYVSSIPELEKLLDSFDKKDALRKGKKAREFWKNELYYQKWCKYVLKELDDIRIS